MEDRSASMLELKSLHVPHGHYDVAILGGGLADAAGMSAIAAAIVLAQATRPSIT